MIIGVSNGNERTFDAAGSLMTRFGKSETPTRATRSIRLDAAAPEPRLAPHTKRAKQPKESKAVAGAIDSPCDGQVVLAGERRKNRPQ